MEILFQSLQENLQVTIKESIGKESKEMQEKITNILEDKIPKLQHDVSALKKATDDNKEEIERLEKENAHLKAENEIAKEKIEDLMLKVDHQKRCYTC